MANKTALEKLKDLEIAFEEESKSLASKVETLTTPEEIEKTYKDAINNWLDQEGELQGILKQLKQISDPETKTKLGKGANQLKQRVNTDYKQAIDQAVKALIKRNQSQEALPATHPGISNNTTVGKHILTQTLNEIEDIFTKMGFGVKYAYEIDTPENAFDHLNMPEDHPARDSWDTLWMENGNVAVPHTSAMQNRLLSEDTTEPIRKIILGKTFRNEATDATHEHTFTQCEGIYLSKNASMSEMLGVLINFFEEFFATQIDYKFTPDYFPFVEPGGQLAIRFPKKKQSSENATELQSEFLEVLGCGMIHPEVIRAAGKDPEVYSGFAWGVGVERLAMIKHGITEIRYFYSNDMKFISQFA